MKELGSIILSRRQELGLRQQELADLAEVGINTLVAIERGKGNPSVGTLSKIADVLGLELTLSMKRSFLDK
mgnify:CR=1 FL=1